MRLDSDTDYDAYMANIEPGVLITLMKDGPGMTILWSAPGIQGDRQMRHVTGTIYEHERLFCIVLGVVGDRAHDHGDELLIMTSSNPGRPRSMLGWVNVASSCSALRTVVHGAP